METVQRSRQLGDESDDEPSALAYKLEEGTSPDDPWLRVVGMTGHDITRQLQKVRESKGFESDAYVLGSSGSYLGPRCLGHQELISEMDTLMSHCEFAIGHYNKEHGTNLKVVNVVQANTQTVYALEWMGDEYYITFTTVAEESGAKSLYQAKVLEQFNLPGVPLKLFICRPKPSSS